MSKKRVVNDRDRQVILYLHEGERRRLKSHAALHGGTMQELILSRLGDIISESRDCRARRQASTRKQGSNQRKERTDGNDRN